MENKFENVVESKTNHFFQLQSESDLMDSFSEKDQRRVVPPKGLSYPIKAEHYFAWTESSGVYVYLIYQKAEMKSPVGVVFKRTYTGSHLASPRLCDWCLSIGGSDQVGMLSVTLNSRQSIGMMLCLDLKCAERLEEAAELSGKSFEKLIHQLYERIDRFYAGIFKGRSLETGSDQENEKVH